MLDGLIDGKLNIAVTDCAREEDITEIRLRVGRPLIVCTVTERFVAKSGIGAAYVVTQKDIDRVLQIASDFSVYSINDEIIKGYVPYKSARIGVSGEGVSVEGRPVTVKNIAYLVIRVPHQIKNAADGIKDKVLGGEVKNTLVISPPGAGKTTLLRELARHAGYKYNTLIIDERYELAGALKGIPALDVGDCDVMTGIPKAAAYENCIRAMSPEIIVTDEIFKRTDAEAIADIVRCGVKVFASIHGADIEAIGRSEVFAPLLECFDLAVVLSTTPRVGAIKETVEL